jgi:hypothetical protein
MPNKLTPEARARKGAYDRERWRNLPAEKKTEINRNRKWTPEQRERHRAQCKAYYQANKERAKTRSTAWYRANQDKARASSRKYARANGEKMRATSQRWYLENREKSRANRRAWHTANIERAKATAKRWMAKNLVRYKTKNRAWKEPNRERSRILNRKLYEKNREKKLAQNKAWCAANPEQYLALQRVANHRRRARLKGGGGNHTPSQWHAILKAHGNRCYYCGTRGTKTSPLTRDHYIPLAGGGTNDAKNLVPACLSCNSRKFCRDPIEFARSIGFLL